MTKKEFIEKWSNYWMLWSNRTLLTEVFEKELNLLIDQENLSLHQKAVLHFFDVKDKLPKLEKNVIIVCESGYVGWGMIAERIIYERSQKTGIYEKTHYKRIEWGQEENGFKYWTEITDVILWAEFPDYTQLINIQ